jgi:hypothetical protein
MCDREWNNPNTLRSHKTTQITTTAFKMDLMLPAMGIKRFTSQSRTPTTIRVSRIETRGMLFYLSVCAARRFCTSSKGPRGPDTGLASTAVLFTQHSLFFGEACVCSLVDSLGGCFCGELRSDYTGDGGKSGMGYVIRLRSRRTKKRRRWQSPLFGQLSAKRDSARNEFFL